MQLRFGVLAVAGEIDHSSAPILTAALSPLAETGGHVRINVREVTFMGSAGLHVLDDIADQLIGRGRIVLLDPSPAVVRVIDLVGRRNDIDIVSPARHVA